jgi:hypothetical protein
MIGALAGPKTKIVATIGPASESPEMLARLVGAGMSVARLNFSHGTFEQHEEVIRVSVRRLGPSAGGWRSWPTSRAEDAPGENRSRARSSLGRAALHPHQQRRSSATGIEPP